MYQSSSYAKGSFINPVPTPVSTGPVWKTFQRYMQRAKKDKYPLFPVPVQHIPTKHFDNAPSQNITVFWLGHSSFLLEIGGNRYLLDPVLSKRISFTQLAGPSRLHPAPLRVEDISQIDAVILSHDHYDHMDHNTLIGLKDKVKKYITPLGVGDILIKWGIEKHKVVQLDWWQEVHLDNHTIVATPARHFSGRGAWSAITRKNPTLWASWCILAGNQQVFFAGDTGPLDMLSEIGQKFGGFDLTLVPIGAYDDAWADIHTTPEQALEVHRQVNGKVAIPSHWATFDLAIHPWSEPICRFTKQAEKLGVRFLTPGVGEKVTIDNFQSARWWEKQ